MEKLGWLGAKVQGKKKHATVRDFSAYWPCLGCFVQDPQTTAESGTFIHTTILHCPSTFAFTFLYRPLFSVIFFYLAGSPPPAYRGTLADSEQRLVTLARAPVPVTLQTRAKRAIATID